MLSIVITSIIILFLWNKYGDRGKGAFSDFNNSNLKNIKKDFFKYFLQK